AGKISAPTSTDTVNILAINDTHGAFFTEDSPGLEKVQSAIEFLEKQYGNHIKIANGDIFQGSYVSNVNYGLPLLEALNLMEFDAFVLGNHEFDWGIEKIEQYADGDLSNGEADFPFLAANIVYKRGGERLPWTEDYVVVEENGYRVGIIGVIGYNLESSIASDKVADYTFLHPVSIVQEHSKTLREELDCDFVFVATHNYVDWENNAYLSLPDESRIDGIICGHTHQRVGRNVFRSGDYYAPIMQSDDKNESIGQMIIHLDDDNNPFIAYTYHHNPLHFPSDLDIINLIIDYANDIEEGNRVIGYTPENLNKSNIGLEMTKAMKEKYDADVTFINTAGVRDTLDTGNIRVKDVFEVFPFDNIIIVASVKGDLLRDLYYKQGSYLYFNPDMDINNIKDNQDYKIVTIDYIYTGSYYLKYFENSIREDHELMRDVFIEYLENYFLK
ncbi:MAG: 5'-nucleotidase C-terminal domain-containing protein, partial [Bacilli bacterium]|nr:5'-nucleotidase C-terminal domain-containing protein [Bacilli bacterium]